jgi:MFS family permease
MPFIAFLLAFSLVEQNEVGHSKARHPKEFLDALRHSVIAKKVFAYNFLIGLGAGLVIPFFNIFLSEKLNAPLSMVGTVMSISQIGMALSGLLAPYLMLSLGKVRSVVFSQLLSIPLLLMIALPQSVKMVILSYILRNILMNMNNPISGSFIMEITPAHLRATVSSLMGLAQNLSRALSVSIGGWLMGKMGYSMPYFVTAFLYLGASVFYWYAFSNHEKELVEKSRIQT